jgi:GTPase SAR1 family protein
MTAVEGFDPRLKRPFSALIAGPSNSGKTCFVKSILDNSEHVLCQKPDNNVWCYSCYEPLYDELLKTIKIKFFEGIPESLSDDELLPPHKTPEATNRSVPMGVAGCVHS